MIKNQQSPSGFLKNLGIIHLAMVSGLVIFGLVSFYIRSKSGPTLDPVQLEILNYISLIFMLINIPLGYWLHSKKMKSVGSNTEIIAKLTTYQSSHIIKIAFFEGAGFLSCIALILGGKNLILIQIVIVLLFILLNTPSASKLTNELNLSPDESDLLNP
jgi:hypothetical protein